MQEMSYTRSCRVSEEVRKRAYFCLAVLVKLNSEERYFHLLEEAINEFLSEVVKSCWSSFNNSFDCWEMENSITTALDDWQRLLESVETVDESQRWKYIECGQQYAILCLRPLKEDMDDRRRLRDLLRSMTLAA
ncbi:hypothetical protein [Shimazuella kribbensis]|uniref:hypothetical protein n=1 Tax=Shimazuella kribbensis TaxID=139808 RepID=UPI0012EB4F08|nr:hypothetical protein [Shimazuella kribbensis]